ncbi:nonstructural protein [Blackfly microvirus SF02]|uniref:Nonstructural protein n=1 Tax=Blackfly microvirus SF02 TaxID=2576452 RepID=A0A4P8PKR1_9VIRU|nr:nonstructural protein [Blackfly microvirus SF02]
MQIFTVYDSATRAYLQPFFCRSNGEAIRSFQDAANDPKHIFNQHIMDYTLFYLGEWDDEGGTFEPNTPTRVTSAKEMSMQSISKV